MAEALRSLLLRTSSHHRPRQLACAIALGVLCGLLPKASLAFCIAAFVCYLLPMHLPLAALACIAATALAPSIEESAGRLGLWALTHSSFSEFWRRIDVYPLIPWLGLSSTVVHGSLVIGSALLLPIYILALPIARRLAPESVTVISQQTDPDFDQEWKPVMAYFSRAERGIDVHAKTDGETVEKLQSLLATCAGEEAADLHIEDVAHRAAQMAEYVDELLTDFQAAAEPKDLPSIASPPQLARPEVRPTLKGTGSGPSGQLFKAHDNHDATVSGGIRIQETAARRPVAEVHHAEALRYLLHHLKALQDRA